MSCLFCAIVAGDQPAYVVHDGRDVVAFLDTRPLFKGHTLVVPREHHVTLPDLPANVLATVMTTAQTLARVVPVALGAQGTFVAMNNVVSQSVPHLHVHVVPRTKGDGLRGFFWPRTSYEPGEAESYADRLRTAFDSASSGG